jgi:hypothetical protein
VATHKTREYGHETEAENRPIALYIVGSRGVPECFVHKLRQQLKINRFSRLENRLKYRPVTCKVNRHIFINIGAIFQ